MFKKLFFNYHWIQVLQIKLQIWGYFFYKSNYFNYNNYKYNNYKYIIIIKYSNNYSILWKKFKFWK